MPHSPSACSSVTPRALFLSAAGIRRPLTDLATTLMSLHHVANTMKSSLEVSLGASHQAAHIYAWVKARTGFEPSFRVVFYPAEYFRRMLGIFPIGDPTQYIPDDEVLLVT